MRFSDDDRNRITTGCSLCDCLDLDLSQGLTVTVQLLISFAALLLKDKYFIAFQMIDDLCFYDCLYSAAYGYIAAIAGHQYIRKFYIVPGFAIETVYEKFVVRLNSELLSCYCYNCKHAPKILRKITGILIYSQIIFVLFCHR